MSDIEIHERLARIETTLERLADIDDKVDALERDMARYRGLYGGVLLVITALIAAFKLFGDNVASFFAG